jgi:hypothetical protein
LSVDASVRISMALEPLREMAAEIDRTTVDLRLSAGRAEAALRQVVWDVRANDELSQHLELTRRQAEAAFGMAAALSLALRSAIERFEAADRAGMQRLAELGLVLRQAQKGTTWGPGAAAALVATGVDAGLRLGQILGNDAPPRGELPRSTICVGLIAPARPLE